MQDSCKGDSGGPLMVRQRDGRQVKSFFSNWSFMWKSESDMKVKVKEGQQESKYSFSNWHLINRIRLPYPSAHASTAWCMTKTWRRQGKPIPREPDKKGSSRWRFSPTATFFAHYQTDQMQDMKTWRMWSRYTVGLLLTLFDQEDNVQQKEIILLIFKLFLSFNQ